MANITTKRKHPLPSAEFLYIGVGIITVLIVAVPVTQWVLPALIIDVSLLFYAMFRARHKL